MTAVAAAPAAMQALIVNADAITAAAASETAYQAIFANAEALGAVVASKPAMEAMIASPSALSAMVASEPVMQTIIGSSIALNAMVTSPVAMKAVAASSTAMAAIIGNSTALNVINELMRELTGDEDAKLKIDNLKRTLSRRISSGNAVKDLPLISKKDYDSFGLLIKEILFDAQNSADSPAEYLLETIGGKNIRANTLF